MPLPAPVGIIGQVHILFTAGHCRPKSVRYRYLRQAVEKRRQGGQRARRDDRVGRYGPGIDRRPVRRDQEKEPAVVVGLDQGAEFVKPLPRPNPPFGADLEFPQITVVHEGTVLSGGAERGNTGDKRHPVGLGPGTEQCFQADPVEKNHGIHAQPRPALPVTLDHHPRLRYGPQVRRTRLHHGRGSHPGRRHGVHSFKLGMQAHFRRLEDHEPGR